MYLYITDIGLKRVRNEDACLSYDILFNGKILTVSLLADGMGGADAGDIASKLFIEKSKFKLDELLSNNKLKLTEIIQIAFSYANECIYNYSEKNMKNGMGTTGVIALIYKNILYGGWIGDSRIYHYQKNKLHLLTKDHSYVQKLIDSKIMNEHEAFESSKKNIITKAVGTNKFIDADFIKPKKLRKNDLILLSSDGLHGFINNENIEKQINHILKNEVINIEVLNHLLKKFITELYSCGAPDNISIILYYKSK